MAENLIDTSNVKFALYETKVLFESEWEDPIADEELIFYEFLIMQTFIQLRLPSEDLSVFWTAVNTDLVREIGEEGFYRYGEKRGIRFNDYTPLYDKFAETKFFRRTQSEYDATFDFVGLVYSFVEKREILLTRENGRKFLEFAARCLQAISVHSIIITEGREKYVQKKNKT